MISKNGEWHTGEMKRVSKLSGEALEFTVKDCRAAIMAMPDNPKNSQYADTSHYCQMEQAKRQRAKWSS